MLVVADADAVEVSDIAKMSQKVGALVVDGEFLAGVGAVVSAEVEAGRIAAASGVAVAAVRSKRVGEQEAESAVK